MNSIHDNGKNDTSPADDLDSLSQLYGQLEQDEPPALLDQAILNSAHRAVERRPHWIKFGWLHGLTTAAVFVLALSLIWNQTESPPAFENGIDIDQNETMLKEFRLEPRSLKTLPGKSLQVAKDKRENGQTTLQEMPAAAATQSAQAPISLEKETGQATSTMRTSMSDNEQVQRRGEFDDSDSARPEAVYEQRDTQNDMLRSDSAGLTLMDQLKVSPSLILNGTRHEEAQATEAAEIEQKLIDIIEMKQSGLDSWTAALQAFKESYPDYPLPDELKE